MSLYRVTVCCMVVTMVTMVSMATRPRCTIRCGVISELPGYNNFQRFVEQLWMDLRVKRGVSHLAIQFVDIKPRWDKTMTELMEAYVDIGSSNVSVVLGPYMHAIATATERHNVPYFVTSDIDQDQYQPYNVISIFPNKLDIYNIALYIVERYAWSEVAVFYENIEGLYFLGSLMQNTQLHVRTWKIVPGTQRDVLRDHLLRIRQIGVKNVLLLTSQTVTSRILAEALKLSMMSRYYSWLIPSLNYDNDDLMQYNYTEVNLTTFYLAQSQIHNSHVGSGHFTAYEYATVADSFLTLYEAIVIHQRNTRNCYWAGREYIRNTLSKVQIKGETGYLRFTKDGARVGYEVAIMALQERGLSKIGLWNSSALDLSHKLVMSNPLPSNPQRRPDYPLGRNVVPVVTILEEPFVRLKKNHYNYTGNEKYEGFCVDLLNQIAQMVGFRYELYLVPDGQYGERQTNGSWSGLIGQLVNGNASLAMAALSITSGREAVIDFTKPYKADGISMVMRRPVEKSSFFQFTDPLSGVVWLLMLAVLFFTSITMYMLDRVAPPPEDSIRFTIHESFWFTFASMMLCGTDIHPRTVAGRMLAGALWLFSLIIISTYTANLAAHLTVSKFDSNIRSVFDLLQQSKVRFGTVVNSDVGAFFQNSKIERFRNLWDIMSISEHDSLVANSKEGFERARSYTDDYAFIWDSPAVKYTVEHDCDLVEVGHPLGSRGYGIGVPNGAHYRDQISMAILKLAEVGQIGLLEHRWWSSPIHCAEMDVAKPSKTRSLSMEKVGGVFIILAVGVVVAILSSILDYLIRVRGTSKSHHRRSNNTSNDKPVYDGAVPTALQLEEPFLSYNSKASDDGRATTKRKQTNIF